VLRQEALAFFVFEEAAAADLQVPRDRRFRAKPRLQWWPCSRCAELQVMAESVIWVWLIGGALLALLELVLPGLVSLFLGLAALAVAGLIRLGLVDSWSSAMTAWFALSIAFVMGLRGFVARLVPGATEKGQTDEDLLAAGQLVDVVEGVGVETPGRIRFGGTTWPARSMAAFIPAGQKARIAFRDHTSWVVESVPTSSVLTESPAQHEEAAS